MNLGDLDRWTMARFVDKHGLSSGPWLKLFLEPLLPLAKIAACYRYLNINWIFCTIFLAAIFIDQLPGMESHARRRAAMLAAGLAAAGVVATVWMARANLHKLWLDAPHLAFIA